MMIVYLGYKIMTGVSYSYGYSQDIKRRYHEKYYGCVRVRDNLLIYEQTNS
jgi:hypothetical protein